MSFFNILKKLFDIVCGNKQPDDKPSQQYNVAHQATQQPIHQPTPHKPTKPTKPSQPINKPTSSRPPSKPYQHANLNLQNQQNEFYTSLRARASDAGDQMAKCFAESREAYNRGDGASAKRLSNEGKAQKAEMERLNQQASDWIFVENNKDSQPGEIDLHGLYVKEAIAHTDLALEQARRQGRHELRLIVGKGLHSQDHGAKIKPAIEELMQKHKVNAELDPHNGGVLVVQLDAPRSRMGADEMAVKLERDDCVIM